MMYHAKHTMCVTSMRSEHKIFFVWCIKIHLTLRGTPGMFERHLVFFDLHRKKIADALGGNQSVDMVLSMYKILVLHIYER